MKYIYPFSAIVGQEEMKKGLLLNAVNPKLSGILIRGEKGTAKSTAVRALAALLPEIDVVADCPFSCDPDDITTMCMDCRQRLAAGEELPRAKRKMRVVDLPVSATEDRVVGTLDIEQAIKKGEKHFEPGVLAQANRGILYVDEVNLLDDHVVDVLLDSAAMGVNTVEREGVSFTHPAQFILVGTMNPEEGELRPQLLDRFGLCVHITGIMDPELRVEVIRRRAAFEEDPEGFTRQWEGEEEKLRRQIVAAKKLLPEVEIPEEMLYLIAKIAIEMGVDGHRADLVMMKAAKTMAALAGRTEVTRDDVHSSVNLALLHRMRRKPFQEMDIDREKLQVIMGGQKARHAHDYHHGHSHR
ncbi:magnesium chelatase ATPase subunit I [Desulfofundulus thermosubterraneus]|uniref:Mg-protoporphyrin IX chelatase n=1 Tax=Desulfofundulus thermosubterraneus DSM 16057 TaxID=1121432 RepID=A0A1M6EGB9_9FIRM|nr:magnesium chelatase ATPase subunit I [Desulfofundulus thermosubterraneus]SHI84514.1 protoporphyrin IX magnesium-chelatase [Desulfofundulus thermosubterraneus DSM 16057]